MKTVLFYAQRDTWQGAWFPFSVLFVWFCFKPWKLNKFCCGTKKYPFSSIFTQGASNTEKTVFAMIYTYMTFDRSKNNNALFISELLFSFWTAEEEMEEWKIGKSLLVNELGTCFPDSWDEILPFASPPPTLGLSQYIFQRSLTAPSSSLVHEKPEACLPWPI